MRLCRRHRPGWLVAWIAVAVLTLTGPGICAETYAIDNQRVLIYKIIAWWYDCLPEEAQALCGREIFWQSSRQVRVTYDATKGRLQLQLGDGLADRLSLPSPLKPILLNPLYFNLKTQPALVDPAAGSFVFSGVDKKNAERFRGIEERIAVDPAGEITGLEDGRIALWPSTQRIKFCPPQENISAVRLSIINTIAGEVLAEFEGVAEEAP